MATGTTAALSKLFFPDINGIPVVSGRVQTYIAGTTTNAPTYTNSALTVANTNPVILDNFGSGTFWFDPSIVYDLQVSNLFGSVLYTIQGVNASNSTTIFSSLLSSSAGSGIDLIGNGDGSLPTIAALRAFPLSVLSGLVAGRTMVKTVLEYATGSGLGGGQYSWQPTNTQPDNSGTVINPTGNSGAGRWILIYQGSVLASQFGCVGNGTDDSTALTNLFSYLSGPGASVTFDPQFAAMGLTHSLPLTITLGQYGMVLNGNNVVLKCTAPGTAAAITITQAGITGGYSQQVFKEVISDVSASGALVNFECHNNNFARWLDCEARGNSNSVCWSNINDSNIYSENCHWYSPKMINFKRAISWTVAGGTNSFSRHMVFHAFIAAGSFDYVFYTSTDSALYDSVIYDISGNVQGAGDLFYLGGDYGNSKIDGIRVEGINSTGYLATIAAGGVRKPIFAGPPPINGAFTGGLIRGGGSYTTIDGGNTQQFWPAVSIQRGQAVWAEAGFNPGGTSALRAFTQTNAAQGTGYPITTLQPNGTYILAVATGGGPSQFVIADKASTFAVSNVNYLKSQPGSGEIVSVTWPAANTPPIVTVSGGSGARTITVAVLGAQ
jgi:hypothetical protein